MDTLDKFEKIVNLASQEEIPYCNISASVLKRLRKPDNTLRLAEIFALAAGVAAVAVIVLAFLTWPSSGLQLEELYYQFELFTV